MGKHFIRKFWALKNQGKRIHPTNPIFFILTVQVNFAGKSGRNENIEIGLQVG